MRDVVSILIPAYNAEKWLRECILSAINQTWPYKEVIVVDDGSSDGTLDVAKSLQSKTVKVLTQSNAGACATRNKALSLAQGDYIQWLDADDLLHPAKVSRQLVRSGEGRNSLTLLTSSWGKFFFRPEKAKFVPDPLWQDHGPVDWIVTKFSRNVWMNPAVWLVSRRLTDLAGPWDERLASSGDDDGEYLCRLVAASTQVLFVPDAKCYYRIGTVGSLNWNMERSDKSLGSLALSLSTSIDHLIRLEDSPRTRSASLQLLQTFLSYFYATSDELVARMHAKANELGGTLKPPSAGWKYYPLERTLGPRLTKRIMNNWRAAKLLARRNWDRSLYQITR